MGRRDLPTLDQPERFREDCVRCRTLRDCALRLMRGQPLGRLQRQLLMAAAPPDAEDGALVPVAKQNAAQVAIRRAVTTMVELGLISVSKPQRVDDWATVRAMKRRQYVRVRTMRRTDLGQAVVDEYASRLRRKEKPGIRWTDGGLQRAYDAVIAGHRHNIKRPPVRSGPD